MNNSKCVDCQEPTKTPVGFWDGRDKEGRSISGALYDCSNEECLIKQEEIKAEQEAEQREVKAKEINQQNGVDIQQMIQARRKARITIRDCADILNISSSKYSGYEHYREAMPLEEWRRIIKTAEEVPDGKPYL